MGLGVPLIRPIPVSGNHPEILRVVIGCVGIFMIDVTFIAFVDFALFLGMSPGEIP